VSETFELRIDSIAAGGDGVGRHNGMVVFVPRTAPGDLARVTAERRDRLMRGRLDDLLEPSRYRADPPCKHYVFDRCGGCQLQHVRYETQLEAKAAIVRDALVRIGRIDVETPQIEATDKPWRYRRKLTLALRRRDDRWIAGLHRYDTLDVFPLEDCLITEQPVLHAWSRILEEQHLLPPASELRGAVRLLEPGFSFTVEGGREWTRRAELFQAIPEMVELWWKPEDKSRRLLESRAGDWAGASFVQVNPSVAEQLRGWVVARALAVGPATAIDGYAGTGDIAVALAEQGTRVVAIEIDRDAARLAASRLPKGSRVVAAPIEMALPEALPADVVILNPPRAGLDARVTNVLRAQSPKPRAVIYVSCNPATLARDIRRLETYRVQSVRAFDMFPQTAHVETVCELVPAE
jgi:23S rRNA (uracil1939-C5)-methyltransferase